MATASLPHVLAAADRIPRSGAWWRRAHSYSLPVVVALATGVCWLLVRMTEQGNWPSPTGDILTAGMIGFIIAECFLLGLWAALGGLATVPRWLLVGAVYLVGATLVAQALFEGDWRSFLEVAPEFILVGGIVMTLFAALLLPLRRLAAWRIDFDPAYHTPSARVRGQVGMMDFAALFCAVSLPLALCRLLVESTESSDDTLGLLLFLSIFSVLVLITAAPVAYAALAHRTMLALALAAIWVIAVAWVQSLAALTWRDLDLFDTPQGFAGMQWAALAYHASVALAIALPLLLLRCCGLALLRVEQAAR